MKYKSLLFTPMFLFTLVALANPIKPIPEKEKFCKTVLQGMAFNEYLEEKCGYGGDVYVKSLALYYGVGCYKDIPQIFHNSLKNEAIMDGEIRYLKYGNDQFCKENRKGAEEAAQIVDQLMSEFYPPADMLTEEQRQQRAKETNEMIKALNLDLNK